MHFVSSAQNVYLLINRIGLFNMLFRSASMRAFSLWSQSCPGDLYYFYLQLNNSLITLRAFHIGTCGMHHKKTDCAIDQQVQSLQDVYSRNRDRFFPRNFTVIKQPSKKIKFVNNGGWSDPRDHDLCFKFELPLEQILKSNPNFALINELQASHVID